MVAAAARTVARSGRKRCSTTVCGSVITAQRQSLLRGRFGLYYAISDISLELVTHELTVERRVP